MFEGKAAFLQRLTRPLGDTQGIFAGLLTMPFVSPFCKGGLDDKCAAEAVLGRLTSLGRTAATECATDFLTAAENLLHTSPNKAKACRARAVRRKVGLYTPLKETQQASPAT